MRKHRDLQLLSRLSTVPIVDSISGLHTKAYCEKKAWFRRFSGSAVTILTIDAEGLFRQGRNEDLFIQKGYRFIRRMLSQQQRTRLAWVTQLVLFTKLFNKLFVKL